MEIIRQIICAVLAIVLAVGPVLSHGAQSRQPAPTVTEAQALERLDKYAALVKSLGEHIDHSQFNLDALLEELDFEADSIVAFVKEQIAFEQYPGLLRGAQGTLMSRAGNSLDQSVLLATLLEQAGLDARIARTSLNRNQSESVLREMARPRAKDKPIGDTEAIEQIFEALGWLKASGDRVDNLLRDYIAGAMDLSTSQAFQAAQGQATELIELLAAADVDLNQPADSQHMIAEAADYFWVQYRDSPAADWQATHPVFAAEPAMQVGEPAEIINERIPADLQFRFGIEVVLEVAQAGALSEKVLIEPRLLPTANVATQPISFTNVPDSLFGKGFEAVSTLAAEVDKGSYIAPRLQGTGQSGPMFDLHGNIIDPSAAGSAATGLFSTMNKAFRSAIGNIGDKSSLPVVTSQAIRLHISEPGGTTQVITRRTFDRIGEAARVSGKPPAGLDASEFRHVRSLFQNHTLMPSTGDIPPAYVMYHGIEQLNQTYDVIRAKLFERAGKSASAPTASRSRQPDAHWGGHAALFNAFGRAQDLSGGHQIYRPGPAFVIHSAGLNQSSDGVEMIDVASNPIRAVDVSGELPVLDRAMALRVGVWETFAEGAGVQQAGPRQNTMAALATSRQQSIPIHVVKSVEQLQGLGLRADTVAIASQDIDLGYALVIPEREYAANAQTGWWRISVADGRALGMLGNGRGVELLEELIVTTISFAAFNYGIYGCMRSYTTGSGQDIKFLCCMAANVAFLVAGLLIGIALMPVATLGGGYISSVTSIYWDLLGLLADPCGS